MRFSGMIEIFDPKTGNPIIRLKWEWVAKLITRWFVGLDYNEEGKGWTDGRELLHQDC
jgi:hypothetical protein